MPSTSNVAPRKIGHVKFFNSVKGYGFIIPDDSTADQPIVEVFVHHTAINGNGFKSLAEGEEVEYDLIQGPKGMQAANVSGPSGGPVQGDPNARRPYQNYHRSRRFPNGHGDAGMAAAAAAVPDGGQYGYAAAMYGMMPGGGGAGTVPYGYTTFYGSYAAAAAPPSLNGQDSNGGQQPSPAVHHHHHTQPQPMFAYPYQPGAAISSTSAPTDVPSPASVAMYPHSPPPAAMAMYYPYPPQQQPYFMPHIHSFVSASSSSISSNQSASSISNNTTPTCEQEQQQQPDEAKATSSVQSVLPT